MGNLSQTLQTEDLSFAEGQHITELSSSSLSDMWKEESINDLVVSCMKNCYIQPGYQVYRHLEYGFFLVCAWWQGIIEELDFEKKAWFEVGLTAGVIRQQRMLTSPRHWSTTEETWVVELRIWCIKIAIVLVLHPTFASVGGPCCPTLDFVIAFWIMIKFYTIWL
jgi:hypothetical protein